MTDTTKILSIENLYSLSNEGIENFLIEVFKKQLKTSSSVKNVFFADAPQPEVNTELTDYVDKIASALICSSIANSSLYGFSKTVNKSNADAYWKANLATDNQNAIENNQKLYDWAFPIYCKDKNNSFGDYLNDKSKDWAKELSGYVITSQFITNTVLKLVAGEENWFEKLNLILYKLYRLNDNSDEIVNEVIKQWTPALATHDKTIQFQYKFCLNPNMFNDSMFLTEVNNAINKCKAIFNDDGSYTDFYGLEVRTFLRGKPSELNIATGNSPDNIIYHAPSVGCFTEGTQILLKDGSEIPIEKVSHKHTVISRDGIDSSHSEEKVIQILNHNTVVYGFNEESPFFSAAHPFWTKQGWKAINPDIARQENPSLMVSKLAVGDVVYRVKSIKPMEYEEILIKNFTRKIIKKGEKIYGLHLIDGPASYHANRYHVKMNYPHITEHRLTKGFSTLSQSERQLLEKQIKPVMPLFKKAIGDFIEAPLYRALAGNPASSILKKPERIKYFPIKFDPKRCKRHFEIRVWNDDTLSYCMHNAINSLYLEEGKLYINGVRIHNFHISTNNSTISWCQKIKDHFTSGLITLTKDGLACAGKIYLGETENKARHYEISGVNPPSVYSSQIAIEGIIIVPPHIIHEANTDTQEGAFLRLSYQYTENDEGDPLPKAVIELNVGNKDKDTWNDITDCVSLRTNPLHENNLIINFFDHDTLAVGAQSAEENAYKWPVGGEIEFTWDANQFSGYMNKYDSSQPVTDTSPRYVWEGKYEPQVSNQQENLINEAQNSEVLKLQNRNIAELISITPLAADVQKMSFDMLVENMKWAIGEMKNGWLENFFGEVQPTLDASRIADIKIDLSFYQNKFAVAYLGQALGKMKENPLSDEEFKRLENFFKTGLAKEDGYNLQTNKIATTAFIAAAPALSSYIDDKETDWATELYNAITTPQQINLMMVRIASGDMSLCKHHATLLNALQKSGELAKKYYKNFTINSLTTMTNNFKLDSKDNIMAWLPDFIQLFINQYINETSTLPGKIRLKEQAQALQDAASEIAEGVTGLASAMADFLVAAYKSGLPSDQIASDAASAFATKFPKLANAAKFFKIAAMGGAIYNVIKGYMDWKDLSAEGKARLITSTISILGTLSEAVPDFIEIGKLSFANLVKIKQYFNSTTTSTQIELAIAQEDKDWLDTAAKNVREFFDAAEKTIKVEGSLWDKVCSNLGKTLKWLGPLTSAAFAVMSTIDFINDLESGATTSEKAFDGIIAVSSILEAVSLVCELAFVDLAPLFGPAAAIFAIVGIVFTIVKAFNPPPPPKSPAQVFMDDVARPFINSLPSAPITLVNDNVHNDNKLGQQHLNEMELKLQEETLSFFNKKWKNLSSNKAGHQARFFTMAANKIEKARAFCDALKLAGFNVELKKEEDGNSSLIVNFMDNSPQQLPVVQQPSETVSTITTTASDVSYNTLFRPATVASTVSKSRVEAMQEQIQLSHLGELNKKQM